MRRLNTQYALNFGSLLMNRLKLNWYETPLLSAILWVAISKYHLNLKCTVSLWCVSRDKMLTWVS